MRLYYTTFIQKQYRTSEPK